VLGRKGFKINDARRWQNSPHLRVSIEYVNAIFDYLDEAAFQCTAFRPISRLSHASRLYRSFITNSKKPTMNW
jgi:hypothetical protein